MYSPPNVIWVMKSGRMGRVRYIAHIGNGRGVKGFSWKTVRDRDHVENLSIYGRITLKWIFGLI